MSKLSNLLSFVYSLGLDEYIGSVYDSIPREIKDKINDTCFRVNIFELVYKDPQRMTKQEFEKVKEEFSDMLIRQLQILI